MGYSIKQKIDICLMAESNPEMIQQDLAHWAQVRYGSVKPPSQTTISRILAKKDEFIALKEHEFKLIRRRRLSNPLLRKVLLEWISQNVWNNIPISPPIILSSASNLWKQLPKDLKEGNGEFSYRWCSQFLSKVNIQLNNVENELYNKLKIWNCEERDQIKDLLVNFDPRKIFTLSEIFLSHDLPLDKNYYNDESDFLTCMLCTNIDGTEKLDPLIIGRYENYPSFENKSSARISTQHGIIYHSNKKKWLTSTLFYDWLSILDKRLALTNRDIVLILDDSASHRIINIKLERIRLLYTSSNQKFSPMNWGIENDFRLIFRILQYKVLIRKQKDLNMKILNKEEIKFTMIEIFDLIKKSWSLVSELTIQSSWKKSGILPNIFTKNFVKKNLFDNQLETELFDLIEEFKCNESWDVLTLLDLTIEQKINKIFLSNDEIVESCIIENFKDDLNVNKRAPFSHELGKPLARLQRLGERLNSDLINFNPFDEYLDNQEILNELKPMSDLVLNNYEDDFMEIELPWENLFNSSTENTPSVKSNFNEKMNIINNFLNLIETENIQLSETTINEIKYLQSSLI